MLSMILKAAAGKPQIMVQSMTSLEEDRNEQNQGTALAQIDMIDEGGENKAAPVASYWVGVNQNARIQIQEHKTNVLGLLKSRTEMAFEIGRHLNSVKGLLPRGNFGQWLKGELGGLRSAQRYMKIAKCFDGEFEHVKILSKDVLNDLSGKRSSSTVRRQVIDFCKGMTTDHSGKANAFAKELLDQSSRGHVSTRKRHSEPESYDDVGVRDLAALIRNDVSDRSNRFIDILRTLGLPGLASQVAQVVTMSPPEVEIN